MKRRTKILTLLLSLMMIATFICISVVSVSAAEATGCGDGNHYSINKPVMEHKDATCTEAGYDKTECLICGQLYTIRDYVATGHTLISTVSADSIVDNCRDCAYTVTYPLSQSGDFPTYDEMVAAIGSDNLIKNSYSNNNALGDAGSLTVQGSGMRWSTWKSVEEGGNSFARIEIASINSILDYASKNEGTTVSNMHAHYDYVLLSDTADTKSGETVDLSLT